MANALKSRHRNMSDPLPIVAEKINALLDRATNPNEAEGACIIAARELARAKARVDDGEAGNITWTEWRARNIRRSQGDIFKALALANVVDPAARLETWLKACRITPAEFGRQLGLRWPYSVRRYLRTDANGRPRKDWRAPRRDIQLQIERATRGCVTRADWAKEVARRAGATISAQSGTRRGSSPSPIRARSRNSEK